VPDLRDISLTQLVYFARCAELSSMRRGLAPVVRHRFTSFEAVRAMVARGHGFTLLNQRPVHDLTYDGGRLVVIQLARDAGRLDIVLASTRPASMLSRRAQAFAEQCRAVVGATAEQPDGAVLEK
jgi:DNA-binding transcriptional LysR family regulator